MEFDKGKILPVSITEEVKKSYLTYAMTVIVGRALPDVRDGLKPAHRRILYAMHQMGLTPNKGYQKSARTVGEVLGKYHPHGDNVCYDTMVRLAQDFNMRYPLIDGHGNFGSIDGDPPAAMRYTEARLAPISLELLRDIDKNTVDFQPNFDDRLEEPTVLPARFPNLLVNGSSGIAVGMATNIPPHNLREVIDGCVALIDDPDMPIKDLMQHIKGPDFPTGGRIMGREAIRKAYRTGRGVIKVRAQAQLERMSNGKSRILVTELPYNVNKARLIEKIAQLVRDKKIDGITDLRDESDREGIRIVIELRRDANPNIVLNRLYKHSQLQETFGIIMLALVDGEPKVLNLKQMLELYLSHQKDVIRRRTKYELDKAEARAHILEGLRIALDHIDEVIALIRRSRDTDEAKRGLMTQFGLSEKQAQAILDMRLQRLTGLERDKIEAEYKELIKTIARLREILQNEKLVMQIIKDELLEVKEKYGDDRRTVIANAAGELEMEDLIAEEDVVITLTHQGYVKRLPVTTYRSQRRGGRGVSGMGTKDEDFVEHLFITTTHHYLLVFTNKGMVYRTKVYNIPEASRQSRGIPIINLVPIGSDELVTAVIPLKDFSHGGYLLTATRQGYVKKTDLVEYETSRTSGLIALTLDDGDELIDVKLTTGDNEIILGTKYGQAIRFDEADVRPMGRTAKGVYGINLNEGDEVVAMDLTMEGADVLSVTAQGYGKRTSIDEFRKQKRYGKGVIMMKTLRNDYVVGFKVVKPGNDLMMITEAGIVIRIRTDEVSRMGRSTRGVKLMSVEEGDRIVALARVAASEDDK